MHHMLLYACKDIPGANIRTGSDMMLHSMIMFQIEIRVDTIELTRLIAISLEKQVANDYQIQKL